jgi:RES domain-containing protein
VTLWRVSNHPTLDGLGGLRASGRWHTRGRRIVYCAPNPATALLEVLVQAEIDFEDIPVTFRYLEIEVPDAIPAASIDASALGADWRANLEKTRKLGDEWLQAGLTTLLRVPSVIVPSTGNVLINPLHPDGRLIRIARIHEHGIDPRLPL